MHTTRWRVVVRLLDFENSRRNSFTGSFDPTSVPPRCFIKESMLQTSRRAANKVTRSPSCALRSVCKMHCNKFRQLSLGSSTQRRPLAAPSLEVSIPSSMIRTFLATLGSPIGLPYVAVRTAFKTCRLILSPTKCKCLVRADTVLPDEGLNQFGVERNGIVIMGNPIGTERYRRD